MSQSKQSFNLKKAVVNELLNRMEKEDINTQRISEIASYIISAIPDNLNDQTLQTLVPTLDDKYSELAPIVYQYLLKYEEKKKQDNVIKKMENFIKFGKLDDALTISKKQTI